MQSSRHDRLQHLGPNKRDGTHKETREISVTLAVHNRKGQECEAKEGPQAEM